VRENSPGRKTGHANQEVQAGADRDVAAADRAKIKSHFRLYDLRHTFATRAVASGADLPTLSALLGHASIQMTMRYVHPAAEQKRVAIEKFEKFRTEGIINAVAAQKSQRVTTKVTTLERLN
jgi:integrase